MRRYNSAFFSEKRYGEDTRRYFNGFVVDRSLFSASRYT